MREVIDAIFLGILSVLCFFGLHVWPYVVIEIDREGKRKKSCLLCGRRIR